MALKGKIYSIARQHDDLNTNELFQSMINKSIDEDVIVMDGRNIAAGSIFAEQIHSKAITADHIKSGAIETGHMDAGTIDVSVLNASQLILPGKNYKGVVINNDGLSMKSSGLDVALSSSSGFNITDKHGNPLIDIDPETGNVIMQVNQMSIGGYSATTTKDIDEIEVGGRNLISDTEGTFEFIKTNSSPHLNAISRKTNVTPADKEYILSFKAKASSPMTLFSYFYDPTTTTRAETSTGFIGYDSDGIAETEIGTEWGSYWIKWTHNTVNRPKTVIVARIKNEFNGINLEMKEIKFEKGKIATDWTPAPEDVEDSYTAVAEAKAGGAETRAKTHADGKAETAETNAKDYAKKQVDDIEIGGRNLLIRHNEISDSYLSGSGSNPGTSIATYPSPSPNNKGHSTMAEAIPVVEGEKLTFTKSGDLYWRNNWLDESYAFISRFVSNSREVTEIVPTGAHYLWVSYPTDEVVQIERGNKVTDWTPAPEDVQAEIDSRPTFGDFDKTDKVTINGGNIKAGTISSKNNYSRISLEDGTFSFGNGALSWNNNTLTIGGNNNLKTEIDKKATQSDIDSAIDNIDIGGRNYLRNTGVGNSESISMFGTRMVPAGASLLPSTGTEYYILESTTSSGEAYYRATAQGAVPSGLSGTWTFSGEVLIPEGTSGVPLTRSQVAIGSPIPWVNSYGNGERLINATKGVWTKFVHTFEMPEGTQSLHLGIKFANNTQEVGDKIHFKNFKLERGNKATDWTPAPEDVENSIDAVDDKATNAKKKTDAWTHPGTTSINGDSIQTGTLSANRINASELSAITANLGTVTAGTIRSKDNAININLDTGTINLSRPLTINSLPVSTKKEVEDAIQDIEVGGRNLYLGKDGSKVEHYPGTYHVGGNKTIRSDDQLPSKYFMRINNFSITGTSPSFFFSSSSNSQFSESIAGTTVMMSMYMRGNVPFVFDGRVNIGTNWTKVSFLYPFYSGNNHFFIRDTSVKTVDISSVKIEKGNKATDWTPAPEDTNKRLDEVEGNINNAVTTIDNTGVTVKDGSFFLEDDTADTKYSLQVKRNMIDYHSFETVHAFYPHYADFTSSTIDQDNSSNTSIGGGWNRVGNPKITAGGATYQNEKVGIFGKSIVATNSNYVFLMLSASNAELFPGERLTFSFHSKAPILHTGGIPRVEIHIVDANNSVVTTIGSKNYPTSTKAIRRHSFSFTIPPNFDDNGHLLRIRLLSANSNEIVFDGTQLVEGNHPIQYDLATETWNLREELGMNSPNLRGHENYIGIAPGLIHTNQITVPNNQDGRLINFMTSDGVITSMWVEDAHVRRKLNVHGNMEIYGNVNGDLETYKNTGKTIGTINATVNSAHRWNSESNSSLKLKNNNNALSFIVGGTQNNRQSIIQGGHSDAQFASALSALYINKFGGVTYIGAGLTVTGAKNAIHPTRDGMRATPAYEMAESYLGDMGEDKTGLNSKIKIMIDTLFFDTVNTDYTYHVFLQAHSNNNVWVEEREKDYFVIASDSPEVSFSWEMKAKRRGFEKDRLVRDDNITHEDLQNMQEFRGTPEESEEVES